MPALKTDKETIIKKTIHLFKVHGYYSTTMANIGDATGLIKGSIYHHFKSKEELALACLQYIHDYFTQNIYSLAYNSELSDTEKLTQFTERVETYFLNSEGGCLLGNFALELANNIPSLKAEIVDYFQHWEDALYQILLPQLGEDLAREHAGSAVATTQGSIMLMRLYDSPTVFQQTNLRVLRLLDSA